jgi:hypothetical protein
LVEKPQGDADLKRIGNLIVLAIAIVYFLLDAVFATIAIPLSRWIGAHWAFVRIHRWILSLQPYPTLLLFIVPLVVLEPAKPIAAYLVGTGHCMLGLAILATAEILKLVFIERLFSVSRDKLLSIPAFAWGYGKYSAAKARLTSLEAWRVAMRWIRVARSAIQRSVSKRAATFNRSSICFPLRAEVAKRPRQRIRQR